MSLRIAVPLVLVLVVAPGCVPVAEPVGDIDRAEPDERLVGTWKGTSGDTWVVDRSPVKGHPKGLMRARVYDAGRAPEGKPNHLMWFFTATAGKYTYVNLLIDPKGNLFDAGIAEEGAYEKWAAKKDRGYLVGLLALDGDSLKLDGGNAKKFAEAADAAGGERAGDFYTLSPARRAELLGKGGNAEVFDGSNASKFKRAKKE